MPLALEAGAGSPVDLAPLALVLLAAWSAGWAARRIGYPAVLGELLAGIVLGPPMLGLLSDGRGLDAIGEFGIVLMMLYIGTEIDLDDLRRASRAGLLAAIGGFVVPFGAGVGVMLAFGFDVIAALFVGAAMGVTSLATKSRILADLRLFETRIAYVLMAGALLSDTATLVLFAGLLAFAGDGGGAGATLSAAGQVVIFFTLMAAAGFVLPRLGRWARERFGLDGPGYGLAVLMVGGLAGAALASALGLHGILGAFVAGMVLRRGVLTPRTTRHAAEVLERLSIGVLAPVFFVTAGFAISLDAVGENAGLVATVVVVATLGKIIGTALFYLPTGHGWREGLVVGGAMNGRGAVEIVVAGIGLERGMITTEVFTVLVVMAILTTALVPVLLKVGVEWLRNRNELADAEGTSRTTTIVGAGPVARTLARTLADHRTVWLLDVNPARCALAQREGLYAVVGDALDAEDLRRARADEAGVLVALTPNSEVNVLAAELARDEFGVRELRVWTSPERRSGAMTLLERIGGVPFVDAPLDLERWDRWVDDGRARVEVTVPVDETAAVTCDERVRDGLAGIPLAVVRGDEMLLFGEADRVRPGDRVHLLVDAGPGATAATLSTTGRSTATS